MEDIKKLVKEKTEEQIKTVLESGISSNNLEYLYKLVDIHKDMANEEYWEEKEGSMYSNYGNYGRYGRSNYGRGGYSEGYSEGYSDGSYGRRSRDSRGRYTGNKPEDKIDEMYMNYQAYSEGKEQYGRSGNYSAKEDSTMCLENMLESMVDFVKMLKSEASSQEEMELIHKYISKLNEK